MAHAFTFQAPGQVREPLGGAWHSRPQEGVVNEPKTVGREPKLALL